MNGSNLDPIASIAVFGVGSIGLSVVAAARLAQCVTIIAVDTKPERLKLAIEYGATDVVNPQVDDPVLVIRTLTDGGVNISLETTARPAVFQQAVDSLAVHGVCVCGFIGARTPSSEIPLDMNSIMFGRTIPGIMEVEKTPEIFIPRLIDLHRQGRFPIEKLVFFCDLNGIHQPGLDGESGKTVEPVVL